MARAGSASSYTTRGTPPAEERPALRSSRGPEGTRGHSKSSSRFPAGRSSRGPPSTGEYRDEYRERDSNPHAPHGGQGILSPSRLPISPSRHSTRPSSALRRPRAPGSFPGRRRDRSERLGRTIGPKHRAQTSGPNIGRNRGAEPSGANPRVPEVREYSADRRAGLSGRIVGPDERRPDAVSGGSGGAPAARTGNGMSRTG